MKENLVAFAPPTVPQEAIDFAKGVAELAEKYGISHAKIETTVDCGYGTKYHSKQFDEQFQHSLEFHYSSKDGRGRPSKRLMIYGEFKVRHFLIDEPKSTD